MRAIGRFVLALLAGLVLGSVVNMALVTAGHAVLPLPPGTNPNDPASLAAVMPTLGPAHFAFPWLAHALGTFAGALVAALIAGPGRPAAAWTVGALFACGGLAAAWMIPAPAWFLAADLLLAYGPMAWLAIRLAGRLRGGRPA